MNKHRLCDSDRELFRRMATDYQSENERLFFEIMRYKQENEGVLSIDMILSDADNDDGLYLDRIWFEEYRIGSITAGLHLHTMNLSEALNTNLKSAGFLDRDMDLLEWLRERDYRGVRYDRNEDLL